MDPLVSIIIITFNQEKYISECVNSVARQDYPNLEVVIADDGSTDGTRYILHKLASKYPDIIKLVLSDVNKGITKNSNSALEQCSGKYIAFTGGDDVFLPNKIKYQVAWLEESEQRSLCGHDAIWINGEGDEIGLHSSDLIPMSEGFGPCGIIRHGPPFCSSSILFRRSSLPEYGFHPKLNSISDWKLMIDLVRDGSCYGYIDGVFIRYRRHGGNVTSRLSYVLLKDQLMTFFISVAQHKTKYIVCWIEFFMYGVRRKMAKSFSNLFGY